MPGGQNGSDRLDRIEHALELLIDDHVQFREEHKKFQEEHKKLLIAQVLLTDSLAKLTKGQKATDDRLNALITIVDGIIRNRPGM